RDVDVRGVILNKIGSKRHGEKAADAIEAYTGVEVLGIVPRDDTMALTMRHLGLVPAREGVTRVDDFRERINKVRNVIKETVDVDRIAEIAREAPELPSVKPRVFTREPARGVRIGVALDEAFNFYYKDNLELLRLKGAEIIDFSPIHNARLPEVDGVVIGGGYPEFFARELSENEGMRNDLMEASRQGMPIYGECGGLMYLVEKQVLEDGRAYPMVGALGGRALMLHVRTIGYVCGTIKETTPAGPQGSSFRGHEFHHSVIVDVPADAQFAYRLSRGIGIVDGNDGLVSRNTIGAYTHIHAAGYPEHTRQLVDACLKFKSP
ncbi:MAG TPA: cobyrinate a,c-diamide synthase, partial [Methanocella sp.]|nr:cobyrinate a,c-diamide synthase [Methanocella sp.]